MSNPLIEKWEELNKKKEEPKVAFELTPEFKEAIDKQKEDRIRYLASLPKDLPSVTTGTGVTASNYTAAYNSSISYSPKPKPFTTYDRDNTRLQFLQVAEMVKYGKAVVRGMTTEINFNHSYSADQHKVVFEVYLDR